MSDFDMARFLAWRRTHPPIMGGAPDENEDATADTADTAQGAVETTTTPPPWGDDFNPDRAWQTISHLRGIEKEWEPHVKAHQRLTGGEDPDAFRALAERYGFEITEGSPEPEDDDDDPIAPLASKLEQIEQWQQQQQQRESVELFRDDVKALAAEAKVELTEKDYVRLYRDAEQHAATTKKNFDRAAVKEVFDEMVDERKAHEKAVIDRYRKSKDAPAPPPTGRAGEQAFDRKGASPTQRRLNREERLAGIIAAEQQ